MLRSNKQIKDRKNGNPPTYFLSLVLSFLPIVATRYGEYCQQYDNLQEGPVNVYMEAVPDGYRAV